MYALAPFGESWRLGLSAPETGRAYMSAGMRAQIVQWIFFIIESVT
jgi:hypothetical protein